MKRYLLFAGGEPRGGMLDLVDEYDTPEEAARETHNDYDWWQVLDREQNTLVAKAVGLRQKEKS